MMTLSGRAEKLSGAPIPRFFCRADPALGFGRLLCSFLNSWLVTPTKSNASAIVPTHSSPPNHPSSHKRHPTAKKGTTQTGHSAGQGNTSVPH